MQNQLFGTYRKYSALIIISALLLLLSAALATLTFYSAGQFAGATRELNLANQQINQIKTISQHMLSLHERYNTMIAQSDSNTPKLNSSMMNTITDVASKKQMVDEGFDLLLDGGLADIGGRQEMLDGTQSPELRQVLLLSQEQWLKYSAALNRVIAQANSNNSLSNINDLPNKVGSYGANATAILTQYHNDLSDVIERRSQIVRWVQIGGIVLSLLLFIGLVFGALRQLIRGDLLLDRSRRETQEILKTVSTGLFLLDKDLKIGSQYSHALSSIVGANNLAGEKFGTILRNHISDRDLRTTEEFIEQLYNPKVKEKLITDLNPLTKVVFNDGGHTRYLDFKFSRVYEDKEIARILVNVEDVSEAVRLSKRLEKEHEQNNRQVEMLVTLLNVEPTIINEFIYNTQQRIGRMNDILKNPGGSQFELEGKLRSIYREMHSLKGEASALKLHSFTQIASEAEDKLHLLQNQSKLSGEDFLSLTVQLDELLDLANTIKELGERINKISYDTSSAALEVPVVDLANQTQDDTFAQYLQQFAKDIADRQGKLIELDMSRAKMSDVPEQFVPLVKEVCVQLLRNAIVHGIADSQTRINNGKSPAGKVAVSFSKTVGEGREFLFAIEDDGLGIDYDAIRQKLIDSKKYDSDEVINFSETQLLGVLFSSGFSTKDVADEDGGRGVGLDIVKERIRQYNGKIHVQSEKGKFSRFVIKLPFRV